MKKIFVTVICITVNTLLLAQTFNYNAANSWDAKPSLHTVQKPFDSSSAVGILDERKVEYVNDKSNNLFINDYNHIIIKLMTDKGIEQYNKVYIAMYEGAEITNLQARSISPAGKTVDLNTNNIKDIEEDNQKYKLFVFDNLEKGSEVEYTYVMKRNLALFGSDVFQHTSMPYLHAKFALVTPIYLKFDAKGYNGFNVSKDSVINNQRIIVGYSDNIPDIDDEKYSETDPYLQRVDYKLSYNLDKNANVRLFTWKEFAKKLYEYYTTRTAKEDKALNGFVAQINVPKNGSDAAKILAIEDYIKTNINIDKDAIEDGADNLETVIKKKVANNDGGVKLFAGAFDKLGINYQIVFPGTRSGYTIDEELENWNRATTTIFYFPSTGKYISPESNDLRYPYIPFDEAATRGLFLKGTQIGDFKTAVANFGNVALEPFDSTSLNTESDITFNDDLDTANLKFRQILRGYGATEYRPVYTYLTADKQADANKEIIKSVLGSDDISNVKIENPEFTNYLENKPLIISADVKCPNLIERAGNRILFKVGAVLGSQVEMYQEKPRVLPVELPFAHKLDRKIVLHIPDGYKIKNPDDINIDVQYKENGSESMGFVSTYVQDNQTLIITINEAYHDISYPLSKFDEFKKVINASADFNKVILVLEKK